MSKKTVWHQKDGVKGPPDLVERFSRSPDRFSNFNRATQGNLSPVRQTVEGGEPQAEISAPRPEIGSQGSTASASGPSTRPTQLWSEVLAPPKSKSSDSSRKADASGVVATRRSGDNSKNVLSARKKDGKSQINKRKRLPYNEIDFIRGYVDFANNIPQPHPVGDVSTPEEQVLRQGYDYDHLAQEILGGAPFKEYSKLRSRLQALAKYSSEDEFWEIVNHLPATKYSHKMALKNESGVESVIVEKTIMAAATTLLNKAKAALGQTLADFESCFDRLIAQTKTGSIQAEAACQEYALHYHKVRDSMIEIQAYCALSQIRVIKDVAHFPGMKAQFWFYPIFELTDLTLSFLRSISGQSILHRLEQMVEDHQFRAVERGPTFELKNTPKKDAGIQKAFFSSDGFCPESIAFSTTELA